MDSVRSGIPRSAARGGQVLLLVVAAALALLVAALWLADLHHLVLGKDKVQNAGDAAALEAARWQGTTLNLEGELNLLHLLALAAGDRAAVEAVTNTQARALFAGPLSGVAAAQQAAKLNGAPSNEEFTEFVRDHARTVRHGYGASLGGELALAEPWEGAWDEYAGMLEALAADGVAAGVDNASFFGDPAGGHLLLSYPFYAAVLGREWCWFHRAAPGLLENYAGPTWWPPLPERTAEPASSAEFLSLRVAPSLVRPDLVLRDPGFAEALEEEEFSLETPLPTNDLAQTWICYRRGDWGSWTAMKDPSFPVEGTLRREYDYAGADAVFRVETDVGRLAAPGAAPDPVLWSGAAKPFGFLSGEEGREPPTASPLVLPVFREVRLIPLDASSMPEGGSFNLRWRRHCVEHVPRYLAAGILEPGCRYCTALRRWDEPSFRDAGVRWLATNSWKCTVSPSGPGGPGGGTRHAH